MRAGQEVDRVSNGVKLDYIMVRDRLVDDGFGEPPLGEPLSDLVYLRIDIEKPLPGGIGIFVGLDF